MGPAFGLLLILATASGAIIFVGGCSFGRVRPVSRHPKEGLDGHDILGIALLIVTLWLWVSSLTYCLARFLGSSVSFDAVFGILVFGGIPRFAAWLSFPLRNWSHGSYRLWQGVAFAGLIAATWFFWTGLDAGLGLSTWKTAATMAPVLAATWSIGILEIRDGPTTIASSCRWRRVDGHGVSVFYFREADVGETNRILTGCDETLSAAIRLLGVEPLRFRVSVFLFPDVSILRKIVDSEAVHCLGFAHHEGISVVYGPWDSIRHTVTHELAHVLRHQRITARIRGLLDEGLAEYVEAEVCQQTVSEPSSLLPTPIRSMAYSTTFYDGLTSESSMWIVNQSYVYAHSFVRYLIEQHGMERFKKLCEGASGDYWRDCGGRLSTAVESVCGMVIHDVEVLWRNWSNIKFLYRKGRSFDEFPWKRFTVCAERAINAARDKALVSSHGAVSADHLLLGVLDDETSLAAHIFQSLGVSRTQLAVDVGVVLHVDDSDPSDVGFLTPEGSEVLDRAFYEARQMGSTHVGVEHLLIGILQAKNGVGSRVLAERGVILEQIRAEARGSRGGDPAE